MANRPISLAHLFLSIGHLMNGHVIRDHFGGIILIWRLWHLKVLSLTRYVPVMNRSLGRVYGFRRHSTVRTTFFGSRICSVHLMHLSYLHFWIVTDIDSIWSVGLIRQATICAHFRQAVSIYSSESTNNTHKSWILSHSRPFRQQGCRGATKWTPIALVRQSESNVISLTTLLGLEALSQSAQHNQSDCLTALPQFCFALQQVLTERFVLGGLGRDAALNFAAVSDGGGHQTLDRLRHCHNRQPNIMLTIETSNCTTKSKSWVFDSVSGSCLKSNVDRNRRVP